MDWAVGARNFSVAGKQNACLTNCLPGDTTGGDNVCGRMWVYRGVNGDVAAASSTGGMTNKLAGRVGDTPIIGAGTYANNATCAVSATGHGEQFIRFVVAYDIAARMEYGGKSLEDSCHATVHGRLTRDDGGVIAVDPKGNIAFVFNSPGMFRGFCDNEGSCQVGIWEEMEPVTIV